MRELFDGEPTRWLDMGDCEVPCWSVGRGPDVVFLHGWPLDGRTWRHIVPEMMSRFRCHVIDLPGAGRSRWEEGRRMDLEAHMEVLEACVEALGLERYALVGHDSGGLIARYHAAAHPERVFGIVAGNTEIPRGLPWRLKTSVWTSRYVPGALPIFRMMLAKRWLRHGPNSLGDVFGDRSVIDGEFYDVFCRPLIEHPSKLAGQLLFLSAFSFRTVDGLADVHPRIEAPVMLLWGADDPWFTLRRCEAMVEQFGCEVELSPLPGGKLFAHEEFPEEWGARAAEFLGRRVGAS